MQQSTVQQQSNAPRRGGSSRGGGGGGDGLTRSPSDGGSIPVAADTSGLCKYPAAGFWLLVHGVSYVVCLVLGIRFSRLFVLLLFYNPVSPPSVSSIRAAKPPQDPPAQPPHLGLNPPAAPPPHLVLNPPAPPPPPHLGRNLSLGGAIVRGGRRAVVGRHGILVRPWPHPNPEEVAHAHRILDRVRRDQSEEYGVKNPRPILAITPTYVRTFQALHLTGVMHSLMLVPYDLTWIVVEAGGAATAETAAILARSKLRTIHLAFPTAMPIEWTERHRLQARMRLHALRTIREKKMEGIVVFIDDSNVHSTEFFDEIQSVKWIGAMAVGILPHSGHTEVAGEAPRLPIQGPACNSTGGLAGWHTFDILPYERSRAYSVGDAGVVLPAEPEWAGFALNARLLWEDAEGKPDWINDLDLIEEKSGGTTNPLEFVKVASFIEPLGDCGKKVLLWWLRVEARADSRFPPGWTLEEPLEIAVPWRRTPWPGKGANRWPPGQQPKPSRSRRRSRRKRRREERDSGVLS